MALASPRLTTAGLAVLCATILVSVSSASMTTVALPDLQQDFNVSDDELTWVVTAYLITFATGTVGYGRLADMHGTKQLYLFGLGLFMVASRWWQWRPGTGGWCARALQGFGGTAIPALSMATIVRTTPAEARGGPMGMIVLTVGVGFGIGRSSAGR
jgi:MFS family permease